MQQTISVVRAGILREAFRGMEILFKKRLPARLENLSALTAPLLECARAQDVEEGKISKLDLALEEVLVNIVYYSYPETKENGEIEISCGLSTKNQTSMFIVEVTDTGKPFDVTVETAYPNISADINNRKIGGLGIYLVKKTMDLVEYHRENDKNVLRLGVNR